MQRVVCYTFIYYNLKIHMNTIDFIIYGLLALTSISAVIAMAPILRLKGTFWRTWRIASISAILTAVGALLSIAGSALNLPNFFYYITYATYIFPPFLMVYVARSFYKVAGKKSFLVSFLGVFSIALITLPLWYLMSKDLVGYSPRGIIFFAIFGAVQFSVKSIAPIGILNSRRFFRGKLSMAQTLFGVSTIFSLCGIILNYIALFGQGINPNISSTFVSVIHNLEFGFYAFVYLLYTLAGFNLSKTLKSAYIESVQKPTSTNPYSRAIESIVRQFILLVGPDVALARVQDVSTIDQSDPTHIKVDEQFTAEVGQATIGKIMGAYTELLGDAAYEFAENATAGIRKTTPEIKIR